MQYSQKICDQNDTYYYNPMLINFGVRSCEIQIILVKISYYVHDKINIILLLLFCILFSTNNTYIVEICIRSLLKQGPRRVCVAFLRCQMQCGLVTRLQNETRQSQS